MSWDAELRLDGLKILLLLLVDNAPVHSDINSKLTHIRVEFMPKNTPFFTLSNGTYQKANVV